METNRTGGNNGKAETTQRQELNNGLNQVAEAITEAKKNKEMEGQKEVNKRYSHNHLISRYKTMLKDLNDRGMLDEEDTLILKHLGRKMIEKFISVDMFE